MIQPFGGKLDFWQGKLRYQEKVNPHVGIVGGENITCNLSGLDGLCAKRRRDVKRESASSGVLTQCRRYERRF